MAAGIKLLMNEISPAAVGATALRASANIIYTDPNDFPVAIEYSEIYRLILLISAMGFYQHLRLEQLLLQLQNRLIGVNVLGHVLQFGVDERGIVPYIIQKFQNVPLAVRIADRSKLNGFEDLFNQQFEANFLAQNYGEAAKMAAIVTWRNMTEGWLKDGKIEAQEPLDNFLRIFDLNFVLSAYLSCDAHQKVVDTYVELGELDKIIAFNNDAMEIMFQKDLIIELTGLMLEVLKCNLPEQI
ncbi:MAG: putative clathrin heavy chain [Streblomastix strix]|uniref:Putative clathrin heavy chain n=1 Tax=Streblomastix strix TaxID=222440 RepID=A0A5J4V557_9EUKA|nr:MAG: putative clathrin heavy chain [Streblomastix strix]